ncbi:carboxymuconolactone decarboxylase family protein [Cohnella suwonensis]|uniref:Carboxymuconolactone decarboxylase family protein n=1 Tax=Cohnella suwonensis TaxID=696072 RepID=A0ABW0M0B9_9BACL
MSRYYDRENLKLIPDLVRLAPQASAAYLNFEKVVYQAGEESAISGKTKELIAVAVAHVTGCPYCIDVHVGKYKALGGTMEEIMEAVLVAASTRAGAILSHATHALLSFEGAAAEKAEERNVPRGPSEPECFC